MAGEDEDSSGILLLQSDVCKRRLPSRYLGINFRWHALKDLIDRQERFAFFKGEVDVSEIDQVQFWYPNGSCMWISMDASEVRDMLTGLDCIPRELVPKFSNWPAWRIRQSSHSCTTKDPLVVAT